LSRDISEEMGALVEHAEEMGAEVEFVGNRHFDRQGLEFAGAYFSPAQMKIWMRSTVARSWDPDEALYVLAHEIGHAADARKLARAGHGPIAEKILKLFRFLCDEVKPIPRQVRWFVVGCERRAWDEADRILSDLGIDVPLAKRRKMRSGSIRGYEEIIRSVNRAAA